MNRILEYDPTLVFLGVCRFCAHKSVDAIGCLAFPDGIPDAIAYGDDKHTSVRSDQKGTFVFKKGAPNK